jgi:hypothetical protein
LSDEDTTGFRGPNSKKRKPEEDEIEHADLTGEDSAGAAKALSQQSRGGPSGDGAFDKLGFQRPQEGPQRPPADAALPVVERESWMMLPPPSSRVPKPDPKPQEPTPQQKGSTIDNFEVHSKELNPQLNPNSPLGAPPP